MSHQLYLATERTISPFSKVCGFHLDSVWGDLMHDLYLGAAGEAIANGLVDLQESGRLVKAVTNCKKVPKRGGEPPWTHRPTLMEPVG